MIEKTFTIVAPSGLHARPASQLVQAASHFPEEITITYHNVSINAKSIMSVMSLGIPYQGELTITIHPDNAQAMQLLQHILEEQHII